MSFSSFSPQEIIETIRMVQMEKLDIRTITMGISLRDCASGSLADFHRQIYDKICRMAERLTRVGDEIEREYGMPIINKRISVTPLAIVAEGVAKSADDFVAIAATLDRAASAMGVNFLGGFSALVHKGATPGDAALMASIPQALATTERVCSSVNIGSTKAGINMDAVAEMGRVIKAAAQATASTHGLGAAKLVVFCNAVEDNPFMAGAFQAPAWCCAPWRPRRMPTSEKSLRLSSAPHSRSRAWVSWSGARRRSASACRSGLSICLWHQRRHRVTRWRASSRQWAWRASARTVPPRRWHCSTMRSRRVGRWRRATSAVCPAPSSRCRKTSA
jgi:hypothetical protein